MEELADRFCANCGTEVDEDARFCPTCGMTLGEEPPDLPPAPDWAPSEPEAPPEPEPKEHDSIEPEPVEAEPVEAEPVAEPSSAPTRATHSEAAAESAEPMPEEPVDDDDRRGGMAPEREPAQPPPPPLPAPGERIPDEPPPPGPGGFAAPPPPPGVPATPPPPRSVAADLPFTWPETLSGWLIGAGSGIAALALIPRLGNGLSILLFVALLGVTATVFLADRMPEIPRLRLLVLVVTMVGLGMALERAAFTVRGVETLFLLAMLVAAGGALLVELDRDRPVSPPGGPRA